MPHPHDVLRQLSPTALGQVASALGMAAAGTSGADLATLATVPRAKLQGALEGLPGEVLASACRGLLLDPSGPPGALAARLLGASGAVPEPPPAGSATPAAGIAYAPEQQRVIAYRGGHLQVIASAGAGKTETIAQRVATLIDEGIEPRAIIAFTFTNEAAAGLKARVLRKAQERGPHVELDRLSPMFVGTLHGFCLRFLQERVPRYATFDLYTDHRLVGLLTREYPSIGLDALGIRHTTEAI